MGFGIESLSSDRVCHVGVIKINVPGSIEALCKTLLVREKAGNHILFFKSNIFEKHLCLCCMDPVSKTHISV